MEEHLSFGNCDIDLRCNLGSDEEELCMITKIDSWKLELAIQLYLNYKVILVSFLGLLENGLENLGFVVRVHMVD